MNSLSQLFPVKELIPIFVCKVLINVTHKAGSNSDRQTDGIHKSLEEFAWYNNLAKANQV